MTIHNAASCFFRTHTNRLDAAAERFADLFLQDDPEGEQHLEAVVAHYTHSAQTALSSLSNMETDNLPELLGGFSALTRLLTLTTHYFEGTPRDLTSDPHQAVEEAYKAIRIAVDTELRRMTATADTDAIKTSNRELQELIFELIEDQRTLEHLGIAEERVQAAHKNANKWVHSESISKVFEDANKSLGFLMTHLGELNVESILRNWGHQYRLGLSNDGRLHVQHIQTIPQPVAYTQN